MLAPSKVHFRHSSHPLNWNFHGDGDQRGPSDPTSHTPRERARGPRTPVRENLQLCIETGKYSLELGEVGLDRSQSDGILFQRIRERYEHIRHSILPMRLRFSKPSKAVFVKASLALAMSVNFFLILYAVQAKPAPLRISNSGVY